ncbi:MAG: AAA family ATPase [Bacteroidota bacterium]
MTEILGQDMQARQAVVNEASAFIPRLKAEVSKYVVGQAYMVDRLLMGLLSGGHILLEGVPGLAKTLAINTLSKAVSGKFSRIQFTPDLLPADVVGTMIFNQKTNEFSVKKGPIFANFILADEINRSPAKVQSALLEAMQEKQVTLGETTYKMEEPFLVLATQNPIEQEGTYPLPEAQVDRFMLKAVISYPTKEDEKTIITKIVNQEMQPLQPQASLDDIRNARKAVKQVYLDDRIQQYIVDIVFATRYPKDHKLEKLTHYINYGGSPRASINLALAAKTYAFIQGKAFVVPEHVRAIANDVLRHRIGLTYEAEAENVTAEQIVSQILDVVEVP